MDPPTGNPHLFTLHQMFRELSSDKDYFIAGVEGEHFKLIEIVAGNYLQILGALFWNLVTSKGSGEMQVYEKIRTNVQKMEATEGSLTSIKTIETWASHRLENTTNDEEQKKLKDLLSWCGIRFNKLSKDISEAAIKAYDSSQTDQTDKVSSLQELFAKCRINLSLRDANELLQLKVIEGKKGKELKGQELLDIYRCKIDKQLNSCQDARFFLEIQKGYPSLFQQDEIKQIIRLRPLYGDTASPKILLLQREYKKNDESIEIDKAYKNIMSFQMVYDATEKETYEYYRTEEHHKKDLDKLNKIGLADEVIKTILVIGRARKIDFDGSYHSFVPLIVHNRAAMKHPAEVRALLISLQKEPLQDIHTLFENEFPTKLKFQ